MTTSGFWKKFRALVSVLASVVIAPAVTGTERVEEITAEETTWEKVNKARAAFYREHFGDLPPKNRMRLINLMSVWHDSSVVTIEAKRLGHKVWAYATFGLSNLDMPTRVAAADPQDVTDELGRLSGLSATMETRDRVPAVTPAGAAGYGYEVMVLAGEEAHWPLRILEWAASAEVFTDVCLLGRVEKLQAFTVRDISVGPGRDDRVHLMFARPQPPLPWGTQLPNGTMRILVATVITNDELEWSRVHGTSALLMRLTQSPVGQVSHRDRKSVLI